MPSNLADLHRDALAALNEAMAARGVLIRAILDGVGQPAAYHADERATANAKQAIDALFVAAEVLQMKVANVG